MTYRTPVSQMVVPTTYKTLTPFTPRSSFLLGPVYCYTPVGFEPTISTGERPQTYALDCAATGTGGVTPLVTVSAFMGCTRKTLPFTAHQCCQHNMSVSFITTDDVWDLDTASYFPLNFIQTFFCRSSLGYLRVKSTIMCYKLKLFGKEQS